MTRDKFNNIRSQTEQLCGPLKIEDYIPQLAVFTSPPIWHLGHTTWFFEEFILKVHKPDYQIFDPQFSYVFNSYYNTIGDRIKRENRGNITRPTVKEVYAYRAHVDKEITQLMANGDANDEVHALIELGLNHEQQHQELLITDLKYTFSQNPLYPVYDEKFSLVNHQNTDEGFVKIEEGVYEIGHDGIGFHYDNEIGRHKVYLHDFEINKALVTNGEYLEFINDDGYQRFEYWLDDGWAWVNENKVTHPLYWRRVDEHWLQYTLQGLKPIEPRSILCHVNFYEAAAFAEWKGMRLPTEFEWEVASGQFNWGSRWEWTNSAYLPYPHFTKAEGAIGEYNGKFMVNQMVLRGASTATAPGHSRKTYRNFFHPPYSWQCTGIRLVKL